MPNTFPLIIKTFAGLEGVLAEELKVIGASQIEAGRRAVFCQGSPRTLYRANLELRTAVRVLRPLHRFQARAEQQLYRGIQEVDWRKYMKVSGTLAVDAVVRSSFFRHSKYAALKTKDAIVDQFRKHMGRRPSIDVKNPHLRIHIHIDKSDVTVALDSSGASLHQRGYRRLQGAAPLNEILASGMILLSGWDGTTPFFDPMCGSGSLLLEAGLIASNRPPGLLRRFGFEKWMDFQPDLLEEVKTEAKDRVRPISIPIVGRDIERSVIRKTRENLSWANLLDSVDVSAADFLATESPPEAGTLIMNPPYGERMGHEEIEDFYRSIGDKLKQHYAGHTAWVLSSNSSAMKRIGLRPDKKHTLYNGALECRYYGYQMYSGSK